MYTTLEPGLGGTPSENCTMRLLVGMNLRTSSLLRSLCLLARQCMQCTGDDAADDAPRRPELLSLQPHGRMRMQMCSLAAVRRRASCQQRLLGSSQHQEDAITIVRAERQAATHREMVVAALPWASWAPSGRS